MDIGIKKKFFMQLEGVSVQIYKWFWSSQKPLIIL